MVRRVAAAQWLRYATSRTLELASSSWSGPDHVMLVGVGALEFAKAWGFQEENLLTEKSRLAWLVWKQSLRDPGNHNNWIQMGSMRHPVRETSAPRALAPHVPGRGPGNARVGAGGRGASSQGRSTVSRKIARERCPDVTTTSGTGLEIRGPSR